MSVRKPLVVPVEEGREDEDARSGRQNAFPRSAAPTIVLRRMITPFAQIGNATLPTKDADSSADIMGKLDDRVTQLNSKHSATTAQTVDPKR